MSVTQVVPGLYAIALGPVNAFLIDSEDLTLIDAGYPQSAEKIMDAVRALGKQPTDIRHILVTHCHPDHAGSLAAVKQLTGAPAYMHAADAAIVRTGKVSPHLKPSPGLVNNTLFRVFIGFRAAEYPAAEIEHEIRDGAELAIAGGIRAIHTPGHCAGHLTFLWQKYGGVLFAADAASNMMGLGYSLGYQDLAEGKRSLAKIAALEFQIACFAHGKPIMQGAAEQFRRKWVR